MTDWLLSVAWYASLLAIVFGIAGVVRPLIGKRLELRRKPAGWIIAGVCAIATLIVLAPAERSVASPATALDSAIPTYQFREVHVRSIEAPSDRVRTAIKQVTADEIALFRLFTAVRRLGRSAPESIMNAPADAPILAVATRSGFILLADTEREVAIGSVISAPRSLRSSVSGADAAWFIALAAPGVVKAGLNFVIEPDGPSRTRVTTETRVFATDRPATRAFTAYWRTIFPGSWILRVTWLEAIAARTEG